MAKDILSVLTRYSMSPAQSIGASVASKFSETISTNSIPNDSHAALRYVRAPPNDAFLFIQKNLINKKNVLNLVLILM
ncbi:MAG: hypothetical protein ACD_9C00271G0010 [uncultured bacterium]|nr:MAG: hypothetical protein ACD_9C00271G0010 [uncultured bacterium]